MGALKFSTLDFFGGRGYRVFSTWGMGGVSPPVAKNYLSLPPGEVLSVDSPH